MGNRKFRSLAFFAFTTLSPLALANGAMGFALEVFDFSIWVVYVVATVILEGLVHRPFPQPQLAKSLGLSLLFNFLTASCCTSGGFAPFLYPMWVDGNPLLWTFELLTVFGFFSALIEAVGWRLSQKDKPEWATSEERSPLTLWEYPSPWQSS